MLAFSCVYFLIVVLISFCDFSSLTLSEKDTQLLYVTEDNTGVEEETDENLFGTSTITQEIDEQDLIDIDAAKQAEEALNQIYNGGK